MLVMLLEAARATLYGGLEKKVDHSFIYNFFLKSR